MRNLLYQNGSMPANYVLSRNTKSIFITSNQISSSFNFISKSWFHFSHFLARTNSAILLYAILQVLKLFPYIFFKCFLNSLFKFIVPSHKLYVNVTFRIISINMKINKVNVIKIYTKNTHVITRKWNITRIVIKKEYIINCE